MVRRLQLLASISLVLAACDPQRADWGLGAIDTMVTPPDNPRFGCGAVLPTPPPQFAATRDTCGFPAGALPGVTLGLDPSVLTTLPIRHVIVVMKENRSFDHLLGQLHDRGQPDVEAIPAGYANPDASGKLIAPFHASTTCWPFDPGHQAAGTTACIDGGAMDGFIRNAAATTASDGQFVISNYDDTDLPFYYWLAKTFAISDRHFAPMVGGTFGCRNYLYFGTTAGVVDTGIVFPPPTTPSIFQSLMNAGFTWGVYTDGSPLSGTLDWSAGDPGVHTLADLTRALDAGTLPNVAFVDGLDNIEDDHPDADLQRGEQFLKSIYDHAFASPEWPRLAMFWTYDEAGAFADHVRPETPGCAALPSDSPFTDRGPRVPLVAISPWARRNFASHVVHDHTAITRFIEAIFNLPALTGRDANSDALFDLFDFSCGRDLHVDAALAPGTGGCTNPAPPGTN